MVPLRNHGFPLLGVLFDVLFAVVIAAIAAKTMRALIFAALRAFHKRRSLDLPDIVPSFIPARLGMFSLRYYRHRQHLLKPS